MNNTCKSLNVIIKIRFLLIKFVAHFFYFMVSLIDQLKWQFGLLWLNFTSNLHCWTLNFACLCRVRTEENISAVSASVNDDHQLEIRRRSQHLGLYYSSTWKILQKGLGVKPFKIQLMQELKPNDLPQRRIFCKWALGKLAEDPLLCRKMVSNDEAHLWLNG